jgi:hypothetical protein
MDRSYCLISENGQSAGNIKYILYIEDPQRLHVVPLLIIKGWRYSPIIAERL